METIGKRLKYAREMRGMSHEEFSRKAQIKKRTIPLIEQSSDHHFFKNWVCNIYNFCMALQISADWLLGIDKGTLEDAPRDGSEILVYHQFANLTYIAEYCEVEETFLCDNGNVCKFDIPNDEWCDYKWYPLPFVEGE